MATKPEIKSMEGYMTISDAANDHTHTQSQMDESFVRAAQDLIDFPNSGAIYIETAPPKDYLNSSNIKSEISAPVAPSGVNEELDLKLAQDAIAAAAPADEPNMQSTVVSVATERKEQLVSELQELTGNSSESINSASSQVQSDNSSATFGSKASDNLDVESEKSKGTPVVSQLDTQMATLSADKAEGKQERLIMLGNPNIEVRMKLMAQEQGLLGREKGSKGEILRATPEKMVELYQKAAEKEGKENQTAFALELKVPSQVSNYLIFKKEHTIRIFVGGTPDEISAKLDEIRSSIDRGVAAGYFSDESGKAAKEKLNLASLQTGGPVQLKPSEGLSQLIADSRTKVAELKAFEDAEFKARKSGDAKTEKPEDKALSQIKAVTDLSAAMSSKGGLTEPDEKNKPKLDNLVYRLQNIDNKSDKEFAALPDNERKNALVDLSAVEARIDSKELKGFPAKNFSSLGPNKAGEAQVPLREKLDVWLVAERARDPEFARHVETRVAALVENGSLSSTLADSVKQRATGDAAFTAAKPEQSPTAKPTEAPVKAAEALNTDAAKTAAEPTKTTANVSAAMANPVESGNAATPAPAQDNSLKAQLADAGRAPGTLDTARVESLIASIDAISSKKLSALDATPGAGPTQTLAQLDKVLAEASSGRHGEDLKHQAQALASAVQSWKQQEAVRPDSPNYTPAESVKVNSGAENGAPPSATGAAPVSAGKPIAALDSASGAKPGLSPGLASSGISSDKATPRPEVSKASLGAFNRVSKMMSNPAGTLTTNDKKWDSASINKLASEVLKLDKQSVAQMAPQERAAAASYSSWVASAAESGRLPGLDEKTRNELGRVAGELSSLTNSSAPDSVAKNLSKAETVVNAMATHQRVTGMTSGATQVREPMAEPAAVKSQLRGPEPAYVMQTLLKDSTAERSPSNTKYVLANAEKLSEGFGDMPTSDKLQTASALRELVSSVQSGEALGSYSNLSEAFKAAVDRADQIAGKLESAADKYSSEESKSGAKQSETPEANNQSDKGRER